VRQLRPGVDGLILEEGFRRGTFLPVVWESLPNPRDFLRHLKAKAGLPPSYWSGSLRVSRYTTSVVHGGEPRRRR
jgi:AMMECR1 domain-containing protein